MARIEADNLKKFWKTESPSGTINGTNDTFVLSEIPLENDVVMIFLNGLFQYPVIDYSISNATIVFTSAPQVASKIYAYYVQKRGE